MLKLFTIGLILSGLLAFPYDALANCTVQTIQLPSGKILTCTVCCFPTGSCNTVCN